MTPNRQFTSSNLRKLRKATIKGALFISLTGVLVAHTGCGSSDSSTKVQHEVVTKQEFTKGVITTVEEVTKGDFAIADEKVVPTKEESRVIVKYLDGKIDTMNMSQAQTIANADPNNKSETSTSSNRGIGQAIWWGVMGYYMGRRTSTPINQKAYKNQATYQRVNSTTNSQAMSSRKTVSTTRPKPSGSTSKTSGSSRSSKPSGSRGFFNSGSRSSGG